MCFPLKKNVLNNNNKSIWKLNCVSLVSESVRFIPQWHKLFDYKRKIQNSKQLVLKVVMTPRHSLRSQITLKQENKINKKARQKGWNYIAGFTTGRKKQQITKNLRRDERSCVNQPVSSYFNNILSTVPPKTLGFICLHTNWYKQ